MNDVTVKDGVASDPISGGIPPSLRWVLAIRCLIICALAVAPARAWAYSCNVLTASKQTIGLPTTLSVPRDLANGTALSAWVTMDGGRAYYNCTTHNETVGVGHRWYNQLTSSGTKFGDYTVWKTNVEGVGIAIKSYAYMSYGSSWNGPWDGPVAGYSIWEKLEQTTHFGGKSEVILVKYGAVTPGKVTAGDLYGLYIGGSGDPWYGKGGYDRKYLMPAIAVTTKACATPDISVDMGNHSPAEFPAVGSRSSAVKFTLAINGCPAGLNGV